LSDTYAKRLVFLSLYTMLVLAFLDQVSNANRYPDYHQKGARTEKEKP
jgi:hypothetical protein